MGINRNAATGALLAVVAISGLAAPSAVRAVNAVLVQLPGADAVQPARRPFQTSCSGVADSAGAFSCQMPLVPAKMEFVVQTASVYVDGALPVGGVKIESQGGGTAVRTFLPLVQQRPGYSAATIPMTQYADPGSFVGCFASKVGASGFVSCTTIGYLVAQR